MKEFIKSFLSGKICLTLVTIEKIQIFLMRLIKKLLAKMKDEFGGVIVNEFLYSIKKIDGKECNTAKGVNIATEINKFKDVLFNKKVIRQKMRKIQSKKRKLGTYEIAKLSLSCFDDRRYVLDDGVYTLNYFHKNSVTN